jgi:hypothetical protein
VTERLLPPDRAQFPPLRAAYVRVLKVGTMVGRIHFTSGPHPATWGAFRRFGPTKNRFDHHPPPRQTHQRRAILCAAPVVRDVDAQVVPPLHTCLVEAFRDTGVVDTKTYRPYFALFRLRRPLRLLDLADSNWITVAGGNAAISSGPRGRSREWARAIYRHYPASDVHGLYYCCSNMPRGRSIALFERARTALPAHPEVDLPLSHPGLWSDVERACESLDLDLV